MEDLSLALRVVIAFVLLTLLFGGIYAGMHSQDKTMFGFETPIDPFYFALTTSASVGYGDYSPRTQASRGVVMLHQLLTNQYVILALLLLTAQAFPTFPTFTSPQKKMN